VQPPSSAYLSDLIWSSMVNGYGPVEKDMSNGEDLQGDGQTITLNGVTYAKGLGAHADSDVRYALAGGCSRFTASVGVDDEVGTFGTVAFQVYSDGSKIYDSGVMSGTSATKNIDVSISGTNELRLVVTDGGDGSAYDHADWALARVECGSGGDTTPPTVTAQTPAPGATGVPTSATPTVSFSEPMTASTVNGTTFTLTKQGAGSPVGATVTYNSNNQTATLTPAQALDPASTYNAVVLGGANGVKDLAGIPMDADSTWSFTTQSGPNSLPVPTIDTPPATLTWKVGDTISFSGHATDAEDGTLPASALSWTLILEHCPSSCHEHVVQTWDGVASGSFSAPDHEYPSYLQLRLTVKDSAGASATTSVDLQPITVDLTFATNPSGLQIGVNDSAGATPFTRTVIVGSANSLSALATQTLGATSYDFVSWSDGGARVHNITAPATPTTYTATYVAEAGPPVNTSLPVITGTAVVGQTLSTSTGTWTGAQPMTYIYRWLRCKTPSINSCALITGAQAQASTYIIVSADRNKYLRAGVRATNAAGFGDAVSNPTAKVR
jgi:hypothetical protein